MSASLCGVWVDDNGVVHTCRVKSDGGRVEGTEPWRPFAWLKSEPAHA